LRTGISASEIPCFPNMKIQNALNGADIRRKSWHSRDARERARVCSAKNKPRAADVHRWTRLLFPCEKFDYGRPRNEVRGLHLYGLAATIEQPQHFIQDYF
jgi:hypothetical protein